MRKVSFNRFAELELTEAAGYYEKESPGLGVQFLEQVDDSTLFLKRFPFAAPKVSGETRRLVLPRFAYNLLYRVYKDRIRILAVAHQKRHPHYWIGRT